MTDHMGQCEKWCLDDADRVEFRVPQTLGGTGDIGSQSPRFGVPSSSNSSASSPQKIGACVEFVEDLAPGNPPLLYFRKAGAQKKR